MYIYIFLYVYVCLKVSLGILHLSEGPLSSLPTRSQQILVDPNLAIHSGCQHGVLTWSVAAKSNDMPSPHRNQAAPKKVDVIKGY